MPSFRVVVAGGSLAGLMTAIALKRLGHDVTVYERVPAEVFEDHGAGMGMFDHTVEFLAKHDLTHTDAGYPGSFRQFLDKDGKEIARMNMLVDKSTTQIPNPPKDDATGRYVHGYEVVRVEPKEGLKALDVYLRKKGEKEVCIEADMVICADGAGGSLRNVLLGDGSGERTYAGYIAWRGTVPESKLTPEMVAMASGRLIFHHQRHNQCVGYFIPGLTGSLKEGERRMNWLRYTNVEEGSAEWKEIMTDINGVLRAHTMPHGKIRPQVWEKQVEAGRTLLPPLFSELMRKTDSPFIQAITDNLSPRVTFFEGRVFLMGDSVARVRPHTAASTSQAAFHALLLERLVAESDGILGQAQAKEYEGEVLQQARPISEKGIQMGDLSQFGAHPMQRSSGEVV